MLYGTDCFGVCTGFADARADGSGSGNGQQYGYFGFSQQYMGLGSYRGLQWATTLDFGWTDFQAIYQLAGATQTGAGNGTYTVRPEGGMPTPDVSLRGRCALPWRGVDLAGVAVPVPDTSGPYA
jgi:hypothetical protein